MGSIGIGVIGCGQFMSRQHIQTIARNPELRFRHLADRNVESVDAVAKRYSPDRVSTDWHAVVLDPDVDVVVAGIVPELHPEITRTALRSGKAVYVEKPLTDSVAEGREIARLSREAGRPVAVGFNRRFAPATDAIDRAFRKVGGPFTMLYRISDDCRVRPPSQDWKNGDRLLIECVHIFDLLCYLTRFQPVGIRALEPAQNDALVTVEFADGSCGTILSSSRGSLAQPKESFEAVFDRSAVEMIDFVEVRIYGDRDLAGRTCIPGRQYDGCDNRHVEAFGREGEAAMIELRRQYHGALEESGVLDDSSSEEAWNLARAALGSPPIPQINYTPDKGWGAALLDFCRCVERGQNPRNADAVDGSRATACAIAARRSIEIGARITLTPGMWR